MKKIIIYLSLVLTLLLNVVPVYATTYSVYTYYVTVDYSNVSSYYADFDFIVKDKEGNEKTITKEDHSVSGKLTLTVSNLEQHVTHYLDVYYLDEYYTTIEFKPAYSTSINLTIPVKEDTGDSENTETTENTESGDSSEGSESSENSSSSTESTEEDVDLSASNNYLKSIHNDLLILIVIISFFEFMKMINIIVRNISGGEK